MSNNIEKTSDNYCYPENVTKKVDNFLKNNNKSFYREELPVDFNNVIFSEKREDEEIRDYTFNENEVYFNEYSKRNKINSFESINTNFNGIKSPKIFRVVYQKIFKKSKTVRYMTIKHKKRIRSTKPRRRREHQDNIRKR